MRAPLCVIPDAWAGWGEQCSGPALRFALLHLLLCTWFALGLACAQAASLCTQVVPHRVTFRLGRIRDPDLAMKIPQCSRHPSVLLQAGFQSFPWHTFSLDTGWVMSTYSQRKTRVGGIDGWLEVMHPAICPIMHRAQPSPIRGRDSNGTLPFF